MNRPTVEAAERLRQDVAGAAGAVLALSLALLSSLVLDTLTHALESSAVAPLVSPSTTARLWVFFVLVPAVLGFAGIGIPCMIRAWISAVRGLLPRRDRSFLVLLLAPLVIWPIEARFDGNGSGGFLFWAVAASARLLERPLVSSASRWPSVSFAVASVSLTGFARYQWQMLGGAPANAAIAPTLFLIAFYAIAATAAFLVASVTANVRPRARWTAAFGISAYACWIVALAQFPAATEIGVYATLAGAFAIAGVAVGLRPHLLIDAADPAP